MARKKVKLAWIVNDSNRRATFKKRKKGLLKKAEELSTLCDVKTCVVVYGGPQEREAEAWPSAVDCQHILQRFKSMPETEQSKKMVDQEGFLRTRLSKTQDQLRRLERENSELDNCLCMHEIISGNRDINGYPIDEATTLAWVVEMRLRNVEDRMHQLRPSDPSRSNSGAQMAPGPSTPAAFSPSQNLTTQGFLPTVLPPNSQMLPEARANPPMVQAANNRMPSWYINPAESFGSSRANEMVNLQPYLDAASAWNSYLHHH